MTHEIIMNTIHPMLTNILALKETRAWQSSIDLANEALNDWLKTPRTFKRVLFVGHGSSLYNGMVAEYLIEHIAGIPSKAIPAFAFATYAEAALLDSHTLVVGISTTGGTQSVCDALDRARTYGAPTLAITAHADSPITQHADMVMLTGGADDQISVKTKSYVHALISLLLLASYLSIDKSAPSYWTDQVKRAAEGAATFLENQRGQIVALAESFAPHANKVFVFGTGLNLGTAEEASLKVIEMAKMYSECQELEDFLHGRLREVDQINPLFFITPTGRASRRVLDFLTVTNHIHAPSIVLTDHITPGIQKLATHVIQIPVSLDEYATPLLYIIPMHLFGYELALQRGYDPNARRYDIVPQNMRYQE